MAPGTRVFVHHHVPCGACEYCARGHETLCATFKATRIEPGRLLRAASSCRRATRRSDLLDLPDAVSDEAATLIEPLACACAGSIARGSSRHAPARHRRRPDGAADRPGGDRSAARTVTVADRCPSGGRWRRSLGARAVEPSHSRAGRTSIVLATCAQAAGSSRSRRRPRRGDPALRARAPERSGATSTSTRSSSRNWRSRRPTPPAARHPCRLTLLALGRGRAPSRSSPTASRSRRPARRWRPRAAAKASR